MLVSQNIYSKMTTITDALQIICIHWSIGSKNVGFHTIYPKFAPKWHNQPLIIFCQSLSIENISLNLIYFDARNFTQSIDTRIVPVGQVYRLQTSLELRIFEKEGKKAQNTDNLSIITFSNILTLNHVILIKYISKWPH